MVRGRIMHIKLGVVIKRLRITVPGYLSCLFSWAALRSSCMFLVICSVLQMTSSVPGRVASASASSSGSNVSEAELGLYDEDEHNIDNDVLTMNTGLGLELNHQA